MTSAAISSEPAAAATPEPVESQAPALALVGDTDFKEREARAEQGVFRDAVIGALIGVALLVPAWVGLVAIALTNAGIALLPPLFMAAGVGVIAGVFMGGWAGTLVGASKLEHFEYENRPKHPGPNS